MLRISFDFGHPAHYLTFRNVLSNNEALGFKPVIFIQEKDVLMNLLKENGHNFYIRRNKNTTLSRLSLLPRDILYTRKIMKEKKVFVNFSKCFPVGSIAARSLSKRSIQFDDTEPARGQILLFRYTANEIWTPDCYTLDFGSKHKKFKGLLQLAYLHPTVFKPDKSIPESYGLLERGKSIIVRIINYQAAHDWKYRSFKDNYENIIKELAKDYDIILSVEGDDYPKKWKKYILKIKPQDYHHILAFSKLYIGSGASSAAEAAILGVPSIYTNFETRGFIDLLENKYNIIKSINPKSLNINDIKSLLEINKSIWNNTKKKIIKNCIDVPNFIENLVKREIKSYYDQ
jgi:hypothetical protein